MARIYKQKNSKNWTADFVDGKGMRVRRSTKTRDRGLAMHIAAEWDRAARAARNGRLVEAQMRRVISELTEQATGEALHFHSCRDWLTEWLAGKKGTTSPRTLLKYEQVCRDFLDHLKSRAEQPLPAINHRDIRKFRDALAKGGRAASTVNMTIRKVLSVPFTAAMRLGYITVNPCAAVDALADESEAQRDTFTPEQVAALIAAAEGDWRGVILTGYYTGLRLGDITNMTWAAVDLDTKTICLKTRKTGAPVTIPLAADLGEWLNTQPRGIGKAPVFPTLAGLSSPGRNGLSTQFKRIMEAAGIQGRITRHGKGKAGRTTSSLTFHSLRHSFNSALANAGVAQDVRQKLTGHASAAMNDRYTHHEVETLRAAIAKLPALK